MMHSLRTAALAVLLPLAAPAAAQDFRDAPAPPMLDARLIPSATAQAPRLTLAERRPVRGAALVVVGAATMWATKKAEGDNGEEGVPFIPLLSGTIGAMTFWYGIYEIVHGG